MWHRDRHGTKIPVHLGCGLTQATHYTASCPRLIHRESRSERMAGRDRDRRAEPGLQGGDGACHVCAAGLEVDFAAWHGVGAAQRRAVAAAGCDDNRNPLPNRLVDAVKQRGR
jgi:hypothetical protein